VDRRFLSFAWGKSPFQPALPQNQPAPGELMPLIKSLLQKRARRPGKKARKARLPGDKWMLPARFNL
jgi:hypothetical protein